MRKGKQRNPLLNQAFTYFISLLSEIRFRVMKALPSIAFNEFKGSAGDVTARVSKGRQVLSARSMHSASKTPA